MKLVVDPVDTEAVAGVMAMAVNAGALTIRVELLEVMPLNDAVTVVLPCPREDATPLAFSEATAVSLEAQTTDPDTLPVVPFEYVPVAVKVTGCPLGADGAVGVMLMLVSTAVFTVRAAVGEVMPLSDAVTVVLPTATPVATPVVLAMVAITVLADAQVTWSVMFAVLPSL